MSISRRDFLLSAASAAGLGLSAPAAPAASSYSAGRRRLGYGAAVTLADLDADPRLGAAVTKYCSAIVPVYELKWGTLRPQRDVFDFEKADRLSQFARDNQLSMRGHCLVWYYGLPDWTREIATAAEAERELVKHIETVVSHYRGRLTSWDVLNEPIPDKVAGPTDRRECFWSRFLGQRYIDVAYRAAAAADPDARLTVNEYDIEFVEDPFPLKREAFRRFDLQHARRGHAASRRRAAMPSQRREEDRQRRRGAIRRRNAARRARRLCDRARRQRSRSAGADRRSATPSSRLKSRDVLQAISAAGPIDTLLTWGLSDRFSWISQMFPRADRLPNRPLPLDADFQPKPFMATLERFTRAAA